MMKNNRLRAVWRQNWTCNTVYTVQRSSFEPVQRFLWSGRQFLSDHTVRWCLTVDAYSVSPLTSFQTCILLYTTGKALQCFKCPLFVLDRWLNKIACSIQTLICNYATGGNLGGEKVYTTTTGCAGSGCPKGTNDGLCKQWGFCSDY